MRFFLDEILEDERVVQEIEKNPDIQGKAKCIAEYIVCSNDYPHMPKGLLPICVLGYLTNSALEKNARLGIPQEITIQTLKDVNIWIKNYETQYREIGLAEFDWLILHYTSRLFQLGRLQFQLTIADENIPEGDFVIETHIPQDMPLTIKECKESFENAKSFYKTYFAQFDIQYFMCHSWLLNPVLAELLNEKSNIVSFMRFWTKYAVIGDDSSQAIERVFGFGYSKEHLDLAPENTSLQKALKKHLLSGKNLNISAGYMLMGEKAQEE